MSKVPLYRAGTQDSADHMGAKQGREKKKIINPHLPPLNQEIYRAEMQRLVNERSGVRVYVVG